MQKSLFIYHLHLGPLMFRIYHRVEAQGSNWIQIHPMPRKFFLRYQRRIHTEPLTPHKKEVQINILLAWDFFQTKNNYAEASKVNYSPY